MVKTRDRNRIDQFEGDIAILDEHEPALTDELREAICIGTGEASLQDVLEEIQTLRKELNN